MLSTIYTSPLHKMGEWTTSSLAMYTDDGATFACVAGKMSKKLCGRTARFASSGSHEQMWNLKGQNLYFSGIVRRKRPHRRTFTSYYLQNRRTTGYQQLPPHGTSVSSSTLVCNRTRASIKALQLLGNSVRGLDHARGRLSYNAICLPVLS